MAGSLGGKVGVAPRVFLKKLVGDVLDRVDQFDDFDPRQHYQLTVGDGELTDVERNAASGAAKRGRHRAVSTATCTPSSSTTSSTPSAGPVCVRCRRTRSSRSCAVTTHCCSRRPRAARPRRRSFPCSPDAANEEWRGLSVLYVCPLRALLNNLEPRLNSYAEWVGRRAQLWHGDTAKASARSMLANPPDILLTTPESLEAMLVSTKVDPRELFADLRAIVVDEVHAFAGDDRGWHLLAVLERLEKLAGRPIQRIGLSATVGNPDELLAWLQGSGAGERRASVVAPDLVAPSGRPPGDVTLDYVGSLDNAAKVIAMLHVARSGWSSANLAARSRSSRARSASATSPPSCRTPRCRSTSGAGPSRPSPRHATA